MSQHAFDRVREVVIQLERFMDGEQFRGWDPYDALNSPILQKITGFHSIPQRAAIHGLKLLPVNLRGPLRIEKEHNPTTMSFSIDAYANLYATFGTPEFLDAAKRLEKRILSMACVDTDDELGWSRNFKFITRSETHEVNQPLTFLNARIGNSLLDLHALEPDEARLNHVRRSIANLLRHCRVYRRNGQTFLGYSCESHPRLIHNAAAIAARLFARYRDAIQGKECEIEGFHLSELTADLTQTLLDFQHECGSWPYGLTFDGGVMPTVDFHQGFVLDALADIARLEEDEAFRGRIEQAYERGLAFMVERQITPDGVFRWRYPRTWPIDIQNQAQGILSLSRAPDERYDERLERLVSFTLDHFWDRERHYFYYQKRRIGKNRIPYMRWAQGSMFHALSECLRRKTASS